MTKEFSYKNEDDLRKLYEKYQTLQDIANQFDCTESNIQYYFNKFGIETNDKHSTVRKRDTPDKELEPNTECGWCDKPIHKKPCHIRNHDNNFCSDSCYAKWISENRSGENHVQYDSVTVGCSNCGSEKEVCRSRYEEQNHFYCDHSCQVEFEDRSTRQQKKKITVICEWCENKYDVYPYRVDRTRFCSEDCKDNWMSEEHCGENHPQYKGGDLYYGEEWFSVRDKVRERDGGVCQYCGTKENELNQKHDVHHIIPVRNFDKINNAHFLENLVQLCRGCHRTVETKSVDEQAELFDCDLQKE